ncbi:MAG: glycosyltransferase [Chloroflexi bacterium]|jgi:cellulose synthase/poly-beta-1,6-N-acetylglucosamine synthase-like glycosyltransferase|nr:glycosyltransferase [Chloroflexota bacterium]
MISTLVFDTLFTLLLTIQVIATLILSIYALHEGTLLLIYWRKTRRTPPPPQPNNQYPWPAVTIQLPLYNERYVAERVIAAACAQHYPLDRLQIQVLDDSTDITHTLARDAVQAAQARGVNISHITRTTRAGYKAGALANGLRSASGNFIAIFDADFVPAPDFLQKVLPHFGVESRKLKVERSQKSVVSSQIESTNQPINQSINQLVNPKIGFVQTRWAYLNREQDAVTRAQALMLDMHFVIEQPARSAMGLLMNFNGSGGVWRRECIEDAGGWQGDTLTEDLDLSYRAGIRGWQGRYLADVTAPSELPASLLAFKRQQARWARGTAQCIRKLMPQLLRSPVSPTRKLAGALHISGYVIHLFIMMLVLVGPIVALLRNSSIVAHPITPPAWFGLTNLVGALPLLLMCVAHQAQGRRWRDLVRTLPTAVMCGIGLSFSDAAAFLAGWVAPHGGEFVRTPKSGSGDPVTRNEPPSPSADYAFTSDWTSKAELGLAFYSFGACLWLLWLGDGVAALPSLLYAISFGGLVLGTGQFAHTPAHTHQV